MRVFSPAVKQKLATQFGVEPICIAEIEWTPNVSTYYADRDIPHIAPGVILELGGLDDTIVISSGSQGAAEVTLTLDDTSGEIKQLFDQYDLHLKTVRIWQWFAGLDWGDRLLVFVGCANSPISWSERERTLTLSVVSKLEDKEIGFSADEGNFTWVPADLIDQAWPLAFGTPLDYPATPISHAVQGILSTGVGIVSGTGEIQPDPQTGLKPIVGDTYEKVWASQNKVDMPCLVVQISGKLWPK
jgi:hypothetical protein